MATRHIVTQLNTPNQLSNACLRNAPQLRQLRRHDPATALAAERLLAAGFPAAAGHRIRQGMHRLLDRLIADRKAGQGEVC